MRKSTGIQATVKLGGFAKTKGGLSHITEMASQLNIPSKFDVEDIQRAQRDCEILAKILKSNPTQAANLFQLIVDNKLDKARQLAKELGINEEEFAKKGGGLLWLVVIVVVLYATDAY